MQPTAQSPQKKQKDTRHKHSPNAQSHHLCGFCFWFFICIAHATAFFFFLFSFGNIIKLKIITMKNANDNFGSNNGSENFYCHKPSLILYTDGVKDMAEGCQAYWLIDLIISHQCKKDVNLERFQVWELKGKRLISFLSRQLMVITILLQVSKFRLAIFLMILLQSGW